MPDPAPALSDPLTTLLLSLPGVGSDPAITAVLSAMRGGAMLGHTGCDLAVVAAAAGVPAYDLHARLIASGLAAVATASAPTTPLVIDGGRVADRRTWMHERALAGLLVARARERVGILSGNLPLVAEIARVLPVDAARHALSAGGVHWQRLAACTALSRGLTLVTGGPGTGKTTVAAVVVGLVALARAREGGDPPQVVLAAPTAKAAQRLAEAVRHELVARGLAEGDAVSRLAGWTSTLHRLFHDPRAVSADLAVIDEVSMADVATLRRALERLPAGCRLLLLGDPDQLASVEPGRVLSDLVALHTGRTPADIAAANASAGGAGETLALATSAQHALSDVQVRLRVNWRSGDAPPLARLVQALQTAGGEEAALAILDDRAAAPAAGLRGGSDGQELVWAVRADPPPSPAALIAALWAEHAAWATSLAAAPDAASALARFDAVRLLSTLRQGEWGSERLNPLWEATLLRESGAITDESGHYHGRPLLVQRNRPDLGLDNGSIGVVWREDGRLVGRFPGVGSTLSVPLHRLDAWTPAWILTVHKAQGSQGGTVEVIGPGPHASGPQRRLATRELVYTGITRARLRCRVWWDHAGLAEALTRRTERAGGFARHLLRAGDGSDPGL